MNKIYRVGDAWLSVQTIHKTMRTNFALKVTNLFLLGIASFTLILKEIHVKMYQSECFTVKWKE